MKNGTMTGGDVTAEEALAYLARRGQRRPKRDWASIMRRVMSGETQDEIAKELGTTGAQLSSGLKRYAERVVRGAGK